MEGSRGSSVPTLAIAIECATNGLALVPLEKSQKFAGIAEASLQYFSETQSDLECRETLEFPTSTFTGSGVPE